MTKKVYVYLALLCCFGIVHNALGQSSAVKGDSLNRELSRTRTDKEKVAVLVKIVDFEFSVELLGAKNHIAQLLALNKKANFIDPLPYELLQKASQLIKKKDYKNALYNYQLAVKAFDRQHKIITQLLMNMRLLYNALNDQEGRFRFYQQQLEYYQVNGPVENMAPCYHGVAGYYRYRAAYNQAITYYFKAADIYKKFDPDNYANDIAVVGEIYNKWGNDQKAEHYLKIALPMFKKYRDSDNMGFVNYVLSDLYLKKKKYPQALAYLDKAIAVNPQKYPELLATDLVSKGMTYISMGKENMAYPYLIRSRAIADSASLHITNTAGDLETDYAFYEYYKGLKNFGIAEKLLITALKKAHDEQSSELQLKYLKELGDFYIQQNRPAIAVRYLDQYFDLSKRIDQNQDQFKVSQYEIDIKDKQQQDHINALKQEKLLQQYQISRRNVLLWVSLIAVLLVSGLLVFIYRQLGLNKQTLTSLQQTQTQLIQSEKMASLGELTAGIAHEIQNPLNFVNNFSEVNTELIDELQEERNKDIRDFKSENDILNTIRGNEQKINMHGKRADSIVKSMLEHSRISSGQKELTDLNTLADEYMRLSYHGLRAKDKMFNSAMETHLDNGLPKVNVVPQDIGRVLLNLFNNAFYAVHQKKKQNPQGYLPQVTLTTSTKDGLIEISVKDNGNGILENIKEKIMQPFFTTKPTGEGTGLGLSLSYDIVVKGHGGSITVDTKEGEFTRFIVSLPVV
ncbi:MAG: hypothetical protein JWR02_2795 [Mucilaginibacter sp.]|nr:hypothetical protein [Mucilaginibacter sp.]